MKRLSFLTPHTLYPKICVPTSGSAFRHAEGAKRARRRGGRGLSGVMRLLLLFRHETWCGKSVAASSRRRGREQDDRFVFFFRLPRPGVCSQRLSNLVLSSGQDVLCARHRSKLGRLHEHPPLSQPLKTSPSNVSRIVIRLRCHVGFEATSDSLTGPASLEVAAAYQLQRPPSPYVRQPQWDISPSVLHHSFASPWRPS